jgi:geranylgeranyl transferase type-1 subunit beta
VSALSFLKQTPDAVKRINLLSPRTHQFESLLQWLVTRQTTEIEAEEEQEEDDEDNNDKSEDQDDSDTGKPDLSRDVEDGVRALSLDETIQTLPDISPPTDATLKWAGFNGRCNKIADTCYSFWTTGALAVRSFSTPLLQDLLML